MKNIKNLIDQKSIVIKSVCFLTFLFYSAFGYTQSYNYEKATEAFKAGNYEAAIDYYTREINDNPKNNEAYFYRALIYEYKENNSLALSDVNIALKNFSKKEKKWLAACHDLKATIYKKIDDYSKALDEYDLAIKATPEDRDYYISRAQIFYNQEQYDKAESDYREVIKMNEGDVQAITCLARNYAAQKKYAQAEMLYNQVTKLNPNYSDGYYFRAIMFKEQKKYSEAISDAFYAYVLNDSEKVIRNLFLTFAKNNFPLAFSKVNVKIAENPEKDDWYFVRAQLNENNNDYFVAIADYNKMLEFSDAAYRKTILGYRADCYTSLGMYDKSIVDYNEVIAIDSTNSYDYSSRADIKRLKGDYAGSVVDFSKAISIKPDEPWFYYRRGWVKDEFLKDTAGGLKDYSEAISISKDYAYVYLHRGRLYREKLKNENKAKEDFEMILNLDTSVLYNGNCRQYALFHLGRNAEAIEWLHKIINEYPNQHNYYDAACLYSLMNLSKESIDALGLAFENGFRDFTHLSKDDDMDNVRNNPDFIKLVADWKKKYELTKSKNTLDVSPVETPKYQTVTIPMKSKGSGTYEVSCKVNELKLNFIFDTGASDISISQTEALFMLKNDYLSESDIKGKERYMDANGDISIGTKIMLKKVEIGGLVLKNISASVVNNKNAPLLFGQSALSKYGKIIIDNKKSEITISIPETAGR